MSSMNRLFALTARPDRVICVGVSGTFGVTFSGAFGVTFSETKKSNVNCGKEKKIFTLKNETKHNVKQN